jgi:1-acyl-sn-glycerol-3-phosphate acyltransferase
VGTVAYTGIGHDYDQKVIDRLYVTFSRYFKRTLDTKEPAVKGLENLLSIPKDASAVIVSTHKSQLDYCVVPWVLRHHNAKPADKPLAIAAGDNLFKKFLKWDFDRILRKAGGYKIIRKPEEGKRMSTIETLLKYTTERMHAGDWFLIFPERGRSYTGEVITFDSAALGLFQKAEKRAGRKVVYVPTAIGYERVPEDRWFTSFQKYKSSPTKLGKLLYYAFDWPLIMAQQYFDFFSKSIGQIEIRFGKPMESSDEGKLLHKEVFTNRVEEACKSLVPAFSTNIICAAFMQDDPRRVGENLVKIYDELALRDALAHKIEFDDIIPRAARFFNAPLRRFFQTGLAYGFARKDIMEYYNNCIAHYFTQQEAPKTS